MARGGLDGVAADEARARVMSPSRMSRRTPANSFVGKDSLPQGLDSSFGLGVFLRLGHCNDSRRDFSDILIGTRLGDLK